jgi:UDP-glucose 4-epimerase
MKTKVLITGANGFIGANLVKYLLKKDEFEIVSITRDQGFDLSTPNWTERIGNQKIDIVIHLAQSMHYRDFPGGAKDMFAVNVASTLDLLDWSYRNSIKRFIFSSTGNVYKPAQNVVDEDSICQPSSMYAATKMNAENLILQYQKYFDVVITRLFGVYGPSQKGMIIPTMIDRVMKNEKITLAKNKGIYLTPLYISDCIEYFYKFITGDYEKNDKIFNLAGNEILNLREIVDIISKALEKTPNVEVIETDFSWFAGKTKYPLMKLKKATSFENGVNFTLYPKIKCCL